MPTDDKAYLYFDVPPDVIENRLLDFIVHAVATTLPLANARNLLMRVTPDGTATVWKREPEAR